MLIGDSSVGKTSIINQFKFKRFNIYQTTIGFYLFNLFLILNAYFTFDILPNKNF